MGSAVKQPPIWCGSKCGPVPHEDSIMYRISIVYLSYMYRVYIVTISGIMAENAGY